MNASLLRQAMIATLARVVTPLVVLVAAIWVGLRSGRLTLVAVPPNLRPIALSNQTIEIGL